MNNNDNNNNNNNNKIHDERHGKLERGIARGTSKPSRGKNPKRHLPGRLALAKIISYSINAIQILKCLEGYKFFKSQENMNHFMYMDGI